MDDYLYYMKALRMCTTERTRQRTSQRDTAKQRETEVPTCVNISFMLLQSVFALKSFAAALGFTYKPGISFTGFLMLFKTAHTEISKTKEEEDEL